MSSHPRGRALIINIREFPDKANKTRQGSEFDVIRLQTLFIQLGFDVEIWDKAEQCTDQVI